MIVDQFGYQSDMIKMAVLSDPQTGFNSAESYTPGNSIEVRRSDNNAVVFSGAPVVWNSGATHSQSGDKAWWFDFSEIGAPVLVNHLSFLSLRMELMIL